MEILLAGTVCAVLGGAVAFALPSWWWLAAPPVGFVALVVVSVAIAAATGSLDGEGGLAMGTGMVFLFLVLIPVALMAMIGIAIGVALGKGVKRRVEKPVLRRPPARVPFPVRDPLLEQRPEAL